MAGLTRRQHEIAGHVALGKTSSAIGRDLQLSQRTVENHIAAIYRKLGLTSRAQLAVYIASKRKSPA